MTGEALRSFKELLSASADVVELPSASPGGEGYLGGGQLAADRSDVLVVM